MDDFPYLKPIADKLDMSIDLSLLETWYPGSIDFVPSRNRHSIREKILDYLPIMSPSEENVLTTWDMRPHLNSEKASGGKRSLHHCGRIFQSDLVDYPFRNLGSTIFLFNLISEFRILSLFLESIILIMPNLIFSLVLLSITIIASSSLAIFARAS